MTARDDAMEEMRAALEPFAKFWNALCKEEPDAPESGHVVLDAVQDEVFIHYSDLRRAAMALASAQEKGEADMDTGCEDDKLPGTADDWRKGLAAYQSAQDPTPPSDESPVGEFTGMIDALRRAAATPPERGDLEGVARQTRFALPLYARCLRRGNEKGAEAAEKLIVRNLQSLEAALSTPSEGEGETLAEDNQRLGRFVAKVMEDWPEGGGFDGGDIQEIAAKSGLLIETMMQEPCGVDSDSCACLEYYGRDEWPLQCYRVTDTLRRARERAALPQQGEG